jgi:beta-lactamase superfamily II metal-dependent hydrolase
MIRRLLISTLLATALAAGHAAAAEKTLKVVELDMEGGGGTLYVTPEGISVLVDTGVPVSPYFPTGLDGAKNGPDRIVAAAKSLGLKKIDYVIITHYHGDHVGGVPDLVAQFPVGTFIDHGPNREFMSGTTPGQPSGTIGMYEKYIQAIKGHKRITAKAGDVFHFGSLTDTIVIADGEAIAKPLPGAVQKGGAECDLPPMAADCGIENAKSIGSIFSFGKVRIAAMGDLTWDREHDLACPLNKVGKVNILIVDNHGLGVSTNPAIVAALDPQIAVFGNGPNKGALPEVVEHVKAGKRLEAVWKVHANMKNPEVDGDPDYLANLGPSPSRGYALTFDITRDGKITASNGRGFSKTYQAK